MGGRIRTGSSPEVSKVSRPRLPEIVRRKRLFRLIDKSRKFPVVWISGPGGSGKTTLAASYLDNSSIPSLWYRMDPGDSDIATFFYYLSLAAKKAAPRVKKPLPLLMPEYMSGIPIFTRRFFEDLCSRVSPPFVIVFDSYQEVSNDLYFHDVFINGLRVVPHGISVFILSREKPPPQFSGMMANNELAYIGWDDLRLTTDESYQMAKLRKAGLPKNVVHALHERIGGWAAGLVLALERTGRGVAVQEELEQGTREAVFGYFAEEIFRRADPSLQDFLMRTSLLPVIGVPVAKSLTGNEGSGQFLSRLHRGNYFTERNSGPEAAYRYHPLFREFLLSAARDSLARKDFLETKKKAAGLLEEAGMTEEAALLYKEAEDWEGMLRLVLTHAKDMISQSRNKTLEGWITCIPSYMHERTPWLLYWAGICRLHFNPDKGRVSLEHAFALFKSQGDFMGMTLSSTAIVMTYHFMSDDFTPLSRWYAEMSNISKNHGKRLSPQMRMALTTSMFVALLLIDPGHPKMKELVRQTRQAMRVVPDISERLIIGSLLQLYHSWMGETAEMKVIIEELRPALKSHSVPPPASVFFSAMEAIFFWNVGAFDDSLQMVSEGLALQHSTGVYNNLLPAQGIYANLMAGDLDKALECIHELGLITDLSRNFQGGHYQYLKAWYFLCKEDLPQALSYVEDAIRLGSKSGCPFIQMLCFQLAALVFFENGEPGKAFPFLEKTRPIWSKMGSKVAEFITYLIEAYYFLAKAGAKEQGLASLRMAFSLGSRHDIVNCCGMRRSMIVFLCLKALEEGIEVGYTQHLIRRLKLVPEFPPLYLENWPWPLKIYSLGRFEIVKDDKPVLFSGKVKKRPLLMLKALISRGGKGVSEDQLADMLWPESEGDAASKSVNVTVTRLRQLLGVKKAVETRNGVISLNPLYCWVDAFSFLAVSQRFDEAGREENRSMASGPVGGALDLYKGPFLHDVDEPWAEPLRERLLESFIRCSRRTGRDLEDSGEYEKAIDCYQKALTIDELQEEFYQRLMICCQKLGRRSEAVSFYQRCKKALSAIGLGPSAETRTIHEDILKEK